MIYAILGFSVAIAAIFSVTVAEMLVGKAIFENHRPHIAAVLAAMGVAFWFLGRYLARKRNIRPRPEADSDSGKHFLLSDLRYWGPMLVVLSAITLFICPLRLTKVQAASAPPSPPAKKEVVAVVAAPLPKLTVPVVFPALKLQGIFFQEISPYTIINGRSYTVGDRLGDIVIKSIERDSIALELSGEVKRLTLK